MVWNRCIIFERWSNSKDGINLVGLCKHTFWIWWQNHSHNLWRGFVGFAVKDLQGKKSWTVRGVAEGLLFSIDGGWCWRGCGLRAPSFMCLLEWHCRMPNQSQTIQLFFFCEIETDNEIMTALCMRWRINVIRPFHIFSEAVIFLDLSWVHVGIFFNSCYSWKKSKFAIWIVSSYGNLFFGLGIKPLWLISACELALPH